MPEPATLGLMVVGLLGAGFSGRKRRQARPAGMKRVEEKIWLVSFTRYDSGFFDHETCRIESAENAFAPKVLPMSPV